MQTDNYVFVVPEITGGGAERVVSLIASELAVLNHNVHVIAEHQASQEYPLNEKVTVHYIEPVRIKKRSFRQKVHKFLFVRNTIREIARKGTTTVIPFLPGCIIHTYYATYGLPVFFIATIRNNPRFIDERFKKNNDRCICKADLLWTQNEDQQQYYAKLGQKRSFVLRNPVNPIAMDGEHIYKKKLRNLIAIGRLEEQKNYELLIDSFGEIIHMRGDVILHIYGEGSLHEKLDKKIQKLGLKQNVILHGRVSDVLPELQKADVFVMSSDYEGMPNALMEAMASGLPCIATDCPSGPAELLSEERGWLTKCGDAAMLTEKILEVIDHPAWAEQRGRNARQFMIRNYSLEKVTLELIAKCKRENCTK